MAMFYPNCKQGHAMSILSTIRLDLDWNSHLPYDNLANRNFLHVPDKTHLQTLIRAENSFHRH